MSGEGESAEDGLVAQGVRELFLQPVQSYNPFEETVAQLARAIRLGAVAVGEKLPPERELSQSLGVSRTTVREAIRGLEQAGYVTTQRGRFGGTAVLRQHAAPTSRERRALLGPALLDSLDFRLALEPGAAALAAQRASAEQIAQLSLSIEEMKDVPKRDYPRANCRFHLLLARATESEPIIRALTDVQLRVMDVLLAVPRLEQSIEHSDEQHRAIVKAIDAGDDRAAHEAMSEHIAASDVILRELIPMGRERK